MGRPIYSHELTDPDFTWLMNSFREANPAYQLVDLASLPLVLMLTDAAPPVEVQDPSLPVPFSRPKKPTTTLNK